MRYHRVSVSRRISAPAEAVYALIADYHNGHPRIVPPNYFRNLEVEQGGYGEGTVIRYEMKVFGSWRTYRAHITEPVPGTSLVETDLATGAVTTFTIVPVENGVETHVAITTEVMTQEGLAGVIERAATTGFLRRVYAQELRVIAVMTTAANATMRPRRHSGGSSQISAA